MLAKGNLLPRATVGGDLWGNGLHGLAGPVAP
jgi:hypothetical protein